MCFCYWTNSSMKRDEGDFLGDAPDWKLLFLPKIKIIMWSSNNFIRKSELISEVKKKTWISQWLGKHFTLKKIRANWGVGEKVSFAPDTVGECACVCERGGWGGEPQRQEYCLTLWDGLNIKSRGFPNFKFLNSLVNWEKLEITT